MTGPPSPKHIRMSPCAHQSVSQPTPFPRASYRQLGRVPSVPPSRKRSTSLRRLETEVTYLGPQTRVDGRNGPVNPRQLSSMAPSVISSLDLPDGYFVQPINSEQVPRYTKDFTVQVEDIITTIKPLRPLTDTVRGYAMKSSP